MRNGSKLKELFKNGTTWLKADFHLHTKSDKEFAYSGEQNEFVKSYIDRLVKNDIKIGVITNHNKFDLNEFKALRKNARKSDILLLPGVELSINDGANGVHTLIIFSEEWIESSNDHINPFLSSVFSGKLPQKYQEENGRTTEVGIKSVLGKLKEFGKDFFVVFAHVEQKSGLWHEFDGGRLIELSQEPLVKEYCMGFQKVRTHDNGEKCRTKVQDWWKSEYPAEVEGSDPKSLDEIGKGGKYTYAKVGAPTFEALKYALTDHKARISTDKIVVKHSHISNVSFEGGLFSGQSVSFSPHMNTLIGIRGSGKSAIIESIRYALGIDGGEEDRKYKENLIAHILGSGGKVTLDLLDAEGHTYRVSRIHREAPKCFKNGELLERIDPRSIILNRPMYFGQKDLAKAGENLGGESLIDKMLGNELLVEREKIANCEEALQLSLDEYLKIGKIEDELEETKRTLEEVEFQIKKLDAHKVGVKLASQQELLGDKSTIKQFAETVQEVSDTAKEAVTRAISDLTNTPQPKADTNKQTFSEIENSRQKIFNLLIKQQELCGKIDKETKNLGQLSEVAAKAYDNKKEEFAEIQREIATELAAQGQPGIDVSKYAELKVQKTRLKSYIEKLGTDIADIAGAQNTVFTKLDALDNVRLEEFKSTENLLSKLNKSQSPIQIHSSYRGDKDFFLNELTYRFKGSGITSANYSKLVENYADFGAIYRDLENASKLLGTKSEVFISGFNEALTELLNIQIPNTFEVNFHGRPLEDHSLGQRASAMMIFVLSQKEGDTIIIDQPEDDLDNQTIYEDVIKILREIKSDKQFIFATHNANFPVLGDAEVVVTCEEAGGIFDITTSSVDDRNCQSRIIKVMEGGREAFSKRRQIYQQWVD